MGEAHCGVQGVGVGERGGGVMPAGGMPRIVVIGVMGGGGVMGWGAENPSII